jgi:hypothetical protein
VSRSKRGRRPRGARDATSAMTVARPARRGTSGGRRAFIVLAVVLLGILGWWSSRRWIDAGHAQRHPVPAAVAPIPRDSLVTAERLFEAAARQSDWAEALRWLQRIVVVLPRDPLTLRQLAEVIHNHQFAITLPDGRPHWLLRNSLARAEWEARSLELLDSSAVVSDDPRDRARAHYWKARAAEYEGLPLDALAEYEAGLAIAPMDTTLRHARDLQRRKLLGEP